MLMLNLFRVGLNLPHPTRNKSKLFEILPYLFSKPQAKVDLSSWGVLNLIDPGLRQKLEKQNVRHKSTFPRMQLLRKKV